MTHEIQTLVQHESKLLDAGQLDDWLDLYTSDATVLGADR